MRSSVLPGVTIMPKGRKIAPGRTLSSLTTPQVRMILRICWTDRYQRRAEGFNRCTPGIRERLARQFDVSVEVIKKVMGVRHNRQDRRRSRFKTIALKTIQREVKERLGQRGISVGARQKGTL